MNTIIWWLKCFYLRQKTNKVVNGKMKWVLCRTACLGNDTYKLLDSPLPIYHLQKARVDYLLNFFLLNESKKVPISAARYVIDDIKPLFFQQYNLDLNFKTPPTVLFMDSLAELVDQKFSYRKDPEAFFCSYYSDVHESIKKEYNADGLLPAPEIYNSYKNFFEVFRSRSPKTDIIFINFPKKLEEREKFRGRHDLIKDAINRLSLELDNFHVLDVPEEIVDWNPKDRNRYHYCKEVYSFLANEIRNRELFKKHLN
jgi:hypothetical protein